MVNRDELMQLFWDIFGENNSAEIPVVSVNIECGED